MSRAGGGRPRLRPVPDPRGPHTHGRGPTLKPPPPLTPAAWLRYDGIRRGLREARPRRILEVGAGEGALAWRLARRFEYVGLEPDPQSFAVASARLARLGRGRIVQATTVELATEPSYDLVCAFEVLEHVREDDDELRRWACLLGSRGHVLVSVPAHRGRFGPADEAVGHHRRYDREDLTRLLTEAGFETVWVEAWGLGLGHVLEWIRHRLAQSPRPGRTAQGTAGSGRWLQPRGRLGGAVSAAAAAPFRLLQHAARHGEAGIGWVALGRRRV